MIHLMEEQKNLAALGGTMRLGEYPCTLMEGTAVSRAYEAKQIGERHRHRYEFNNEYREQLEEKGLRVAGVCAERNLVEIVELQGHPWFVGVQFHPELKSRPVRPHPLFRDFVGAALKKEG